MENVIVIGSTGLIGTNLLEVLSGNEQVKTVYSVSRSKPEKTSPKVIHIPFDSGNYNMPSNTDAAFCALGTTMKKAGSKEAFLEVDLKMATNFASKAKEAGINRLAVVSSIGANPKSSNFYLRTKGQMEDEIKNIGFERLVIVRPSLLLGKRNEKRFGEDVGKILYSVFRFIFVGPLSKYRGVQANHVAKAMINLTRMGQGTIIAESNTLKIFSEEK